MSAEATTNTLIKCRHRRWRVKWQPTYRRGLGSGSGYYEVGIFDSTATCLECKEIFRIDRASAPLCQGCLSPLSLVSDKNGTAVCTDEHGVEVLLQAVNVPAERARYIERHKRYWTWYCARKEAKEGRERTERRSELRLESLDERIRRIERETSATNFRHQQGQTLRQVWPYVCTCHHCQRHGHIVFIHTPGD